MKICAVTMVYRDYWALAQWVTHYGTLLGIENVFVVAHGKDSRIEEICNGANVITVPRDRLAKFDRVRATLLNGISSGLSSIYDWVIRTDADELICLDTSLYDGFEAMFAECSDAPVFALGFDVIQRKNERPLEDGQSVFDGRDGAIFSGAYSKAFAVCDKTELLLHGVRVRHRKIADFKMQMPRGVYLAHLRYANLDAMRIANAHRMQIASGDESGLPGVAWKHADDFSEERSRWIEAYPEKEWYEAEDEAYHAVSASSKIIEERSVVRAKAISFKFKTTLPQWFREQYG